MELIPKPMALPGCCFKCRVGSENRIFFIDFDFSMDDFGAVLICNECLAEMAHAAGYLLPQEADTLKILHAELTADVEELQQTVFGLEQALDGLRIAGRRHRTDPVSDDSDSVPTEQSEPQSGGGKVDSRKVKSAEPVHDEGVAELSDDADADESSFSLGL